MENNAPRADADRTAPASGGSGLVRKYGEREVARAAWSRAGNRLAHKLTDPRPLDREACALLVRCSATLSRLDEEACSYEWADTPTHAKKIEQAEARAHGLAAFLGLTLELNGDPRGCPFYAAGRGLPNSDMGGRGFGIHPSVLQEAR